MELRVLRYFVEASRAENISRAAHKLHVSQPAISKQLKQLEEELGKKLFKRSNYSIELTAEGMLFRSRAEDILDMVQRTKTEFSTMDDDIAGDVYIGGAETAAFRCLAEIATKIRETHPRICYHIYSGNYEDMDYRLEKGLLDFVLTLQSVKQDEFDSMKLPDGEIWGVIMRKDNPLAQKKRIRLTDLKEEPLICSREAMREEYPSWFGEEIKNMNIAATFNLLNNAAILAKEGLGVVVGIDRLINNDDGSELCFRPLSPKLVSPLHLIWRKYQHLSPAAELFLKEMKQRYVSDSESYSAL